MFNKAAIAQAKRHAENIHAAGNKVELNSPMGNIPRILSIIPSYLYDVIMEDDLMDALAAADMYEDRNATLEADHLAVNWANAVQASIGELSTTVTKETMSYLEALEETLAQIVIPNSAEQYEIIERDPPMWFLDNSYFFKDNNLGTTPSFPALNAALANPLDKNVLKTALTGSGVDTGILNKWVTNLRTGNLKASVAAFNGVGSSDYLYSILENEDVFDRLDDAVIMIIMSRILEGNPPDSINVSPANYNSYLNNVRLLAQSVITRTMPMVKLYAGNSTLIISSSGHKKSIEVYGPSYQQYLSSGGTADAILGRLISTDKTRSISDILSKTISYTQAWVSFVKTNAMTDERTRLNYFKRAAKSLVDKMTVTEVECRKYSGGLRAGESLLPSYIKNDMVNVIDKFTTADMNDVERVAIAVVGEGRFYFLDAASFLTDILVMQRNDNSIKTNEAVYYATIQHIARHIATQIHIERE